MESSAGPGMPLPKYCSVATTLKAPCCDLSFTCPFALQVPWPTGHNPLTRYAYHPYLHTASPVWQGTDWLGIVGGAADTLVLARRERDGFYYRAQIKPTPELERQGTLLVEFETPLVTGPKLPAQRQNVVLEDVIWLSPSVEHLLQPGDKVLAPWEPGQQRYGPGTVLSGLEARNLERASKDKEITVYFWNGKTAQVPLSEVTWVPPAIWKKAVERLHKPFTRELSGPLLGAPRCSPLGPVNRCVTSRLPPGTPLLCQPCQPTCCQLLCQGCLCCHPLAGTTWWPLTRTSKPTAREHPETELKPTAQLLSLDGPKEKEVAVCASRTVSSSSSSSSEADLEKDLEMGLPHRLMVNSSVNTDPVLLEKSPRQSGLCQPEWRYWRRNGPEPPHPSKPGTGRYNLSGKKRTTANNREHKLL
ncbi:uncharacterized protein C11orf16 homolog [Dasypus novemcinctus]|uniref:uncharacterized protein C11orf16 homolog n=1 Tax=Dasypus novemcinctus TaxID=9361 RepID=UPI00265EA57E|nr:uncharacterized protein C11orf16 homolog [Dasypus novemcinctus]